MTAALWIAALWCGASLPLGLLVAGCIRVGKGPRPSRPVLRLVPPLDEERAR